MSDHIPFLPITQALPVLFLLAALLLGAGCTMPVSLPPGSIPPAASPGPEVDACSLDLSTGDPDMHFLKGESCYFRNHTPVDFLRDLRTRPHQPVMVLDVPAGWIALHDAEMLMQGIDSLEPAAPVVSPLSSYWPFNQTSTAGNEALFLLEGYRTGRYPPALCSLYYFKPNRTEVQSWWDGSGRWGILDERGAIRMVQEVYRDLAAYPSPLQSIRTERVPGGWYVAFIEEGSGLPILSARCYFAGDNRTVLETGTVNRSIMVLPHEFSPQRCGA